MVDLASYKDLYITTTEDYLKQLDAQLGLIQENLTNADAVSEIHRLVHTIKSRSFVMGYKYIGEVCKQLENLFYEVKNGSMVLTVSIMTEVVRVISEIKKSVAIIAQNGNELDISSDSLAIHNLMFDNKQK